MPRVSDKHIRHFRIGNDIKRATYSIPECAVLYNVGVNQAYNYAKEGLIPVIKIGKTYKGIKSEIDKQLGIVNAEPQQRTMIDINKIAADVGDG
jgi:hypothetical protein